MRDEPPARVRAGFRAVGPARRLPGGGGDCRQVGDLVLKPDQHPPVGPWLAGLYAGLGGPGFRVPRPVRADDGAWVVDGWAAWTWVEGEPAPLARWADLVAACRAFHAALAGIERPAWVGRRRDRWAIADRMAWGEGTVAVAPELADLVDVLIKATRPLRSPRQLVHGDIAGNVLFAADQPPAIIDFSPMWRPAGYALAIAAVDLLTWSGAAPAILGELAGEDDVDQLLVRALIFRLVTESLGRTDPGTRREVRRVSEPVADLLLARISGSPAPRIPPPATA